MVLHLAVRRSVIIYISLCNLALNLDSVLLGKVTTHAMDLYWQIRSCCQVRRTCARRSRTCWADCCSGCTDSTSRHWCRQWRHCCHCTLQLLVRRRLAATSDCELANRRFLGGLWPFYSRGPCLYFVSWSAGSGPGCSAVGPWPPWKWCIIQCIATT